jgi:hypothetical protein
LQYFPIRRLNIQFDIARKEHIKKVLELFISAADAYPM